ncbi:MAG: hypothetical protein RR359_05360 [Bacilli bacterium]
MNNTFKNTSSNNLFLNEKVIVCPPKCLLKNKVYLEIHNSKDKYKPCIDINVCKVDGGHF